MAEPAIIVRGIQHCFGEGEGREKVLVDVNLTLQRGEIVTLTGPSGSGKTTLLTLIGALRSIQTGSIEVLGRDLRRLDADQKVELRRNVGFIFQAHNLFDSLTAFQNVLLATELFTYAGDEATQRTRDILVRLGLEPHVHKKPHILSEGQRQRVAIGRALVNSPQVVIADEPTAALDKEIGERVMGLFRQMAASLGTTVLIVTHDKRVLDVADRIIAMLDGSVVSDVTRDRLAV